MVSADFWFDALRVGIFLLAGLRAEEFGSEELRGEYLSLAGFLVAGFPLEEVRPGDF
jgi:hypothetical protein